MIHKLQSWDKPATVLQRTLPAKRHLPAFAEQVFAQSLHPCLVAKFKIPNISHQTGILYV
jgi:hypothetical protein